MGTWGHGSFDNDDAADWLADLQAGDDLSVVHHAFEVVLGDADGFIESCDCCNALAAAEIVAALDGKPATVLPDGARSWVRGKAPPPQVMRSLARTAVRRVRDHSELRDRWEARTELKRWLGVVDDLVTRL